jgi:hypothetical protein
LLIGASVPQGGFALKKRDKEILEIGGFLLIFKFKKFISFISISPVLTPV